MHYGTGHDSSYFEDDIRHPDAPAGCVFRPTTVERRPELDHFHAAIHRGAIGVIERWRDDPGHARDVLQARRLLEHDIHNAPTPEQRARYVDELRRALTIHHPPRSTA